MTERLHFHFSLSCIGEGNGNPLQCSCLENPRDGGAWWAAVYGVTQSQTRLKRLSSSSSNKYIRSNKITLVMIWLVDVSRKKSPYKLLYVSVAAVKLLVVSDSVQPHRRQPTRLPHPWDSLGKNTGVGCHFL